MRDDVDSEAPSFNLVDGQRHAVDSDRALARDQPLERRRHLDREAHGLLLRPALDDTPDAVDMARDDMAAQLVADLERSLEVDARADLPVLDRGEAQRLG